MNVNVELVFYLLLNCFDVFIHYGCSKYRSINNPIIFVLCVLIKSDFKDSVVFNYSFVSG